MIKINNLSFSYPQSILFESLNLNLPSDTIHVIMGPSGCGKTTLLHLLASLLVPQKGTIEGVNNKRVSYIFQEPRLLPWRTVEENITLALHSIKNKKEVKELVTNIIQKVGLTKYANYYPQQLSGGMRQRVSMARAFAYPSDLILLDEPFQNLDIKLKGELMQLFQCLWQNDKRTVVCVTHDVDEALALSQSILIMNNDFQNKIMLLDNSTINNELEQTLLRQFIIESLSK